MSAEEELFRPYSKEEVLAQTTNMLEVFIDDCVMEFVIFFPWIPDAAAFRGETIYSIQPVHQLHEHGGAGHGGTGQRPQPSLVDFAELCRQTSKRYVAPPSR